MANPSGLVVLEGRWEKSRNTSIKSLFDVLVDINFGNPHAYYFETFANDKSLEAILQNIGRYSQTKYIYIGAHGNENQFYGSSGAVSRTRFRTILSKAIGPSVKGIFFGSCLFGSQRNASFFLDPAKGIPPSVKWIAGYRDSVDWIESSVLDMLFWNSLFYYDTPKRVQLSPKDVVEATCETIQGYAEGLIGRWHLQVYSRTPGPSNGLRTLLQHNYFEEDKS